MAKILLVEDDNNLREIYEARLQAEGYTIVSAQDGEDALVKAKQEKPDLVISDVMMPRISGFEMLDILRNTEGLKTTKVIMLTALGQAEDKTRADSLGADRYLVKSQVTLEDIVKAAGELLAPEGNTPTTAAPTATSVTPAAPVAVPAVPEPVQAVTAVPKPQPAVPAPTQVAPPPVTTPSVGPLMPVTPPQQNETPVPSGPTPTIAVTPAPAVSPAPSPNPSAPPTIPSPATPTIPSRPTPPSAAPSVQTPTPVVTSAPTGTSAEPIEASAPSGNSELPAPIATATNDQLIAKAVRDLAVSAEKAAASEADAESSKASAAEDSAPEISNATSSPTSTDGTDKPSEPAGEALAPTPPATDAVNSTAVSSAPVPAKPTPEITSVAENEKAVGNVAAAPGPESPPVVAATAPISATSTADEEALMQAQINDFIQQQDTSAAAPAASNLAVPPTLADTSAPAPDEVVAPSSEPDKPSTATTPLPSPTPAPHDQDQNTTSTEVEYQDGVPIAHKKIIQPPVGPATTQPDLSELLAKEGITNMEEETHPNGQAMPPGTTTPHQPGHVITPDSSGSNEPPAPQNQNAFNPLDPNNIAL